MNNGFWENCSKTARRIGCVFLLAVPGLLSAHALEITQDDVLKETVSFVEEFSAPAHPLLIPDQTYSPISTFNGNTYMVYCDEDRHPRIVKLGADGTAQVERLDDNDDYRVLENGHHKFSLGIDQDGYIHVAGDMHHYPLFNTDHLPERYKHGRCMYWVSDRPEDISSFSFAGNDDERSIIGLSFTYSYFSTDRNGVLFFASRIRSREGSIHMYGIWRYDTKTRSWRALGAVPEGGTYPVVVHEPIGNAYQGMRGDIRFDRNNRMHVAVPMNGDGTPPGKGGPDWNTHILYACSDDLGETFQRMDGTSIAMPFGIEDEDHCPETAAAGHYFSMPSSIAFNKDNEPWVYFIQVYPSGGRKGRKAAKWSQWSDENGWSEPADLPLNAVRWDRQYNDGRGIITLCSLGGGVYRTTDLRQEGVLYKEASMFCIDQRYLYETGELKGIGKDRSGAVKIILLKTDLPDPSRYLGGH